MEGKHREGRGAGRARGSPPKKPTQEPGAEEAPSLRAEAEGLVQA